MAIERADRVLKTAQEKASDKPFLIAQLKIEAGATYYLVGRGKDGLAHLDDAYDYYALQDTETAEITLGRIDFWRARVAQQGSNRRKAVEHLNSAISIYEKHMPNSQRLMIAHAMAIKLHEKLGESDKATAHCRAIAKVQPGTAAQAEQPIYRVTPDYPRNAAQRGVEGYALLIFDVNDAGFATNIETRDWKGSKTFVRSARRALKKYRYIPGFKDGKPTSVKGLAYKFNFTLAN